MCTCLLVSLYSPLTVDIILIWALFGFYSMGSRFYLEKILVITFKASRIWFQVLNHKFWPNFSHHEHLWTLKGKHAFAISRACTYHFSTITLKKTTLFDVIIIIRLLVIYYIISAFSVFLLYSFMAPKEDCTFLFCCTRYNHNKDILFYYLFILCIMFLTDSIILLLLLLLFWSCLFQCLKYIFLHIFISSVLVCSCSCPHTAMPSILKPFHFCFFPPLLFLISGT